MKTFIQKFKEVSLFEIFLFVVTALGFIVVFWGMALLTYLLLNYGNL